MHGDWGASTRLAIQAGSCMITPRVCLLVESVSLPLHYRNTGTGLSQEYSVMGPTPAHHRNKQTNKQTQIFFKFQLVYICFRFIYYYVNYKQNPEKCSIGYFTLSCLGMLALDFFYSMDFLQHSYEVVLYFLLYYKYYVFCWRSYAIYPGLQMFCTICKENAC